MSESVKNKIKLGITILIIVLFLWFLVISPMIEFRGNEKEMEKAARRYFELNSNELPTGERIKTISLMTLYSKSFLENDFKTPYSKKTCNLEDSWVKVRREDGEYKYHVYLECGVLSSTIDHEGPEIKLNGSDKVTIGIGEKYEEQGVKSVVDNKDGKMSTKNITIKGKVDTNKIGTYEVRYSALDKLNNRREVIREVTVVQKLNSTVKKALGNSDVYTGIDPNNYVYFSNMLFRIVGIEGKNVKIVADKDISNVNYDGIDEWFKYYEEHLTDSSKELIVEDKYCNMKLTDDIINTTQCNSYSEKKKFGLLTADVINRANGENGNYLLNWTMSWTGNGKDGKNAYVTRNQFFFGHPESFMSFEKVHNFGIRPMLTIKGDTLIEGGDGSSEKPYILTDYVKPKVDIKVNERVTGEYVKIGGLLWRIVDVNKDGSTKVICESNIVDRNGAPITLGHEVFGVDNITYNPKQKGNVGYFINNRVSEYIETKYFVNKEIVVPIYKGEPNYNKEIKTKKYNVKLSAPNMYEMFSAIAASTVNSSYWLINSTESKIENPGISDVGAVMYGEASTYYNYGVRVVANLHKDCLINNGNGTSDSPYVIVK